MRLLLLVCLLLLPSVAPAMQYILLETSRGPIKLELDDQRAPETVKNFLTYAETRFYDGTIFHRVIDNFMIQGGGYTANLQAKPTRAPIRNEAANGLKNLRGTIAMARTQVSTAPPANSSSISRTMIFSTTGGMARKVSAMPSSVGW